MRKIRTLIIASVVLSLFAGSAYAEQKIYIHRPYEGNGPYVVTDNFSWDLKNLARAVWNRLSNLIATHPKEEIRIDLRRLIEEKAVDIAINSDEQIYHLSGKDYYTAQMPLQILQLSEGNDTSGIKLRLQISIPFMLGYHREDGVEGHRQFIQLGLWHEYRHIRQNREGRFLPNVTKRELNTNVCVGARLVWDSEWEAYNDQWELAKEIRATRTMPNYGREVKKWGEKRGILEAFADALNGYTDIPAVHACWRDILEEKRREIETK